MKNISNEVSEDVSRLRQLIRQCGRKRSLRDPIYAACEQMKLTPPQFHALMWLGSDGPLPMGELARRLGITEKTMTGVIDRLERQGVAERIRDETDRRVVRTRLTRSGMSTFRKLDAQIDVGLGTLLNLMDPLDRSALLNIFDRLLTRLEGHAAPELRRLSEQQTP